MQVEEYPQLQKKESPSWRELSGECTLHIHASRDSRQKHPVTSVGFFLVIVFPSVSKPSSHLDSASWRVQLPGTV